MGDRDVVVQAHTRNDEPPPLTRQFREQLARDRQTSSSTSIFRRIFSPFKTKPVLDPTLTNPQQNENGGSNLIADQSIDAGSPSNNRKDPSLVDPSKVHGFRNHVLSLQQYLLARDSGFKSAAIFGVPGVGKTTLCQLVFNHPELEQRYFPRIWVTLSHEKPNRTEAVVRSLLEELGVDEEIIKSVSTDRGFAGLLYALYLQLAGKPYLVVLDSVQETDECCQELRCCANGNTKKWGEEFCYGFPKGCGGAVLITTRSERAAKTMVGLEGFMHHLEPLSDPNSCWLIYQGSVLAAEGEAPATASEEVKEELRKKSGGLPRALIILREIKQAGALNQNSIVATSHS